MRLIILVLLASCASQPITVYRDRYITKSCPPGYWVNGDICSPDAQIVPYSAPKVAHSYYPTDYEVEQVMDQLDDEQSAPVRTDIDTDGLFNGVDELIDDSAMGKLHGVVELGYTTVKVKKGIVPLN